MAEPQPAEQPGLTQRLIKNSARIHKRSNALLMAKVAALFTDRVQYGKAIGCFYLVFAELEPALTKAMSADKRVGLMHAVLTPLYRVPGYEQDLQFYLGDGWAAQIPRSPAIQAYIDRLHFLANEEPLLLLAHAFTQHMAGLSGGRIIKRMARKHMKLPEDKGTAIFDFPGGVEMKDAFKQQLDAVGSMLSEEELQQVLDEQILAFDHNIAIMREFKMGLLPQLLAPMHFIPVKYWAAAAAAAAALVATVAYSRTS